MGKHAEKKNVLYKDSNVTLTTCSQSKSDVFQYKSGIITRNHISRGHIYYTEKGKLKRDRYIETNNCILRRYCKNKFCKHLKGGSSMKSKNSNITTDIAIDEVLKGNSCASGDRLTAYVGKLDITTLMLQNLRDLLAEWIDKNVLDDTCTKKKFFHIFDSIINSLKINVSSKVSSCSTYVLERNGEDFKVRNRKTATNPVTCQFCRQKQTISVYKHRRIMHSKFSRSTVPVAYKPLRIVSTLSVPRQMNKSRKDHHRTKVNKDENINSKLLKQNVYDKSYKEPKRKLAKTNEQKSLVILQNIFHHKSDDYSASESEYSNLTAKPETISIQDNAEHGLMKTIYANEYITRAQIAICENKADIFTMTDKNKCTHVSTQNLDSKIEDNFNSFNQNDKTPLDNAVTISRQKINTKPKIQKNFKSNSVKRTALKSSKVSQNFKGKRNYCKQQKYFTQPYKKIYEYPGQDLGLLGHLQNIFQYISKSEIGKNIHVDIHINFHQNPKSEKSVNSSTPTDTATVNQDNTEPSENKSSLNDKLTDNYLLSYTNMLRILEKNKIRTKFYKSDSSHNESESLFVKDTVLSNVSVREEIRNLKSALQNLSATTERAINEHFIRRDDHKEDHGCNNSVTQCKRTSKSKGIQFSNTVAKGQLLSGIKLSKSPKKMEDLIQHLKKRSSSYHIIESESVLRVTDMTLPFTHPEDVQESVNAPKQSKSQIQVKNDANNQNLMAFYYDEYKTKDVNQNQCLHPKCSSTTVSPCENVDCRDQRDIIDNILNPFRVGNMEGDIQEYSSVCVDVDKPIIEKKRKSLSFMEGLSYCILLWIPIAVIMYFFYEYVLRDLLKGTINTSKEKTIEGKNLSRLMLKLSDFGY